MIRRATIAIAAAGIVIASMAGCSQSTPTGTSDKAVVADSPAATTTPSPSGVDTNAKFGETVTYEDVELTVSAAEPYTPSAYAATGTQPNNVAYTYTIKNTGTENFDPSLMNVTASSAGAEAQQIYDTEGGLSGTPSTSIPAGQTATFKLGFNLANPDSVVMDVNPGVIEYKAATYTN